METRAQQNPQGSPRQLFVPMVIQELRSFLSCGSSIPWSLVTPLLSWGNGKRARRASLHLHLLSLEGTHVIGEN